MSTSSSWSAATALRIRNRSREICDTACIQAVDRRAAKFIPCPGPGNKSPGDEVSRLSELFSHFFQLQIEKAPYVSSPPRPRALHVSGVSLRTRSSDFRRKIHGRCAECRAGGRSNPRENLVSGLRG